MSRGIAALWIVSTFTVWGCLSQLGAAQESAASGEPEIAAIVGDHPISVQRVERHLKKTLGNSSWPESVHEKLLGESLQHLIRRHMVLDAIQKAGADAGPSEIRLEVARLEDRLNEIEQSLDEYLSGIGLTREELEYEFRWRIAWQKYLEKELTDENLDRYFQQHHRQFDGTQIRVAHLLIQGLGDGRESAKRIREEIQSGKTGWVEAVEKYSNARSSKDGDGEIGWVSFDGPMPQEFCAAAMQLEVGQVSPPVETAFGTHLIKCLEVLPGKIGPSEARDAVRRSATESLFYSLADSNAKNVKVQYKVAWGHPDPE